MSIVPPLVACNGATTASIKRNRNVVNFSALLFMECIPLVNAEVQQLEQLTV
jgi:hypothetical protein